MEKILIDSYLDVSNPSAFSGINNLYQSVRKKGVKTSRQAVVNFLAHQDVYTLHKPVRKRFPRLKTFGVNVNWTWQCDLVDYSMFKDSNDGICFLLVKIDVYSRVLHVLPLTKKSALQLYQAFETLFKIATPVAIVTDRGNEFYNNQVQRLFHYHGIKHYSPSSELKAAMVERANRTLKNKLSRYMTAKNTHRYIDILQNVVNGLNHTLHTGIGVKPISVKSDQFEERTVAMKEIPKFSIGDKVRISKQRHPFAKGYEKGNSEEIFEIHQIVPTSPLTYRLIDLAGEEIIGKFYTQELVRVFKDASALWRVERVLKKRRRRYRNGFRTEYFVKWYGFPDKFNSWVDSIET